MSAPPARAETLAGDPPSRAPWLDHPLVTLAFSLAVAILTWDSALIIPTPGLDPSWILGLNLAAESGLDHGTQFVFTYGPLGFLEQPMVVDGLLATLAAVYLLAIRTALVASILWAARQSFPWPAAAALAVVVAALIPRAIGSVPLALTAIWCLVALQRSPPRWVGSLLVFGGGTLAALETVVKLNIGPTMLVLVGLTLVLLPTDRVRNLATLAGVFAAAFTLLWLAAGQGLDSVGDYVSSSVEIVAGYGGAMQANAAPLPWDGWAALAVAAVTLAATAYAGVGLPWMRRLGMLAVVGLLLLSLEKYAFVRHDAGHVAAFFGTPAAVLIALRWQGAGRVACCAAIALTGVFVFAAADETLDRTIEPEVAYDQLTTLVLPGEREDARTEAKVAMRAAYAVDPRIIERIGDAPVDVRPWEVGLVWAYDLDWRPLPVIQDYSAYTPDLDRRNADALAAEDGPRFVLRHLGFDGSAVAGIDGRYIPFDSPLVTRELLCGFRPVITAGAYQLLERARDRCGEPRGLGAVTAAHGEPIAVPRALPGEAVFARIEGAGPQGIERLRALAYRAAIRVIDLGPSARARLLTANAASGLLLRAPEDADFPAPFALAPNVDSFAIDSKGGFASSSGQLEVSFFAVPIAPLAPAR